VTRSTQNSTKLIKHCGIIMKGQKERDHFSSYGNGEEKIFIVDIKTLATKEFSNFLKNRCVAFAGDQLLSLVWA